jgi:hypothetical protein
MEAVVMCEFADWLGWLSMSPYEQWQLVIRSLTVFAVGFGAWWAIWSWLTAKKIEFELRILENSGTVQAYFDMMKQLNYDEFGRKPSDNVLDRINTATAVSDRVTENVLGFRELRELSKRTNNIRHYIETLPVADQVLTERMELKRRRQVGTKAAKPKTAPSED